MTTERMTNDLLTSLLGRIADQQAAMDEDKAQLALLVHREQFIASQRDTALGELAHLQGQLAAAILVVDAAVGAFEALDNLADTVPPGDWRKGVSATLDCLAPLADALDVYEGRDLT
jgi:hypothetical protein